MIEEGKCRFITYDLIAWMSGTFESEKQIFTSISILSNVEILQAQEIISCIFSSVSINSCAATDQLDV